MHATPSNSLWSAPGTFGLETIDQPREAFADDENANASTGTAIRNKTQRVVRRAKRGRQERPTDERRRYAPNESRINAPRAVPAPFTVYSSPSRVNTRQTGGQPASNRAVIGASRRSDCHVLAIGHAECP